MYFIQSNSSITRCQENSTCLYVFTYAEATVSQSTDDSVNGLRRLDRAPLCVENRIFTGYSTTGWWWMIEGARGGSKVQ